MSRRQPPKVLAKEAALAVVLAAGLGFLGGFSTGLQQAVEHVGVSLTSAYQSEPDHHYGPCPVRVINFEPTRICAADVR